MSSVKTWRVVLLVAVIVGLGWLATQFISGGSISDQAVVKTSSDTSVPPPPTTTDRTEALDELWASDGASSDADTSDNSISKGTASGSTDTKINLDPTALIASASHGGEEEGEIAFQIQTQDDDAAAPEAVEADADADGTDGVATDTAATDTDGSATTALDDPAGDDADGDSPTDDESVTDTEDSEDTVESDEPVESEVTTTTTTSTTTTTIYIDPNAEADEEEIRRVQAAQAAEEARQAEALNPVLQQQTSGNASPPKVTTPQATTSSALHVTEYGADGLPILQPLPTNPYAKTPNILVGRIRIPRLGVDHTLHQGMTLTAINRGPSQWPGTALPGEVGNMVIGGHRTTYSRPFRNLDDLNAGDEIIYDTSEGSFTYLVTSVEIVSPNDVAHVAGQSLDKTATLFACHPPGSARQRIIVKMAMA